MIAYDMNPMVKLRNAIEDWKRRNREKRIVDFGQVPDCVDMTYSDYVWIKNLCDQEDYSDIEPAPVPSYSDMVNNPYKYELFTIKIRII